MSDALLESRAGVLAIDLSSRVSIGLCARIALASQNTWNAPSETIPTWDLRNDLHDTCPQLKFSANCIRHVVFLGISKIQCACVTLCGSVLAQCMLVLHGNSTIVMTPKSSYGRPVSQKRDRGTFAILACKTLRH